MLQLIEPTFARPDIIARCAETSAYLCKTRAQYSLVVPDQNTRHWKRSRFNSDAEAIEAANRLLK